MIQIANSRHWCYLVWRSNMHNTCRIVHIGNTRTKNSRILLKILQFLRWGSRGGRGWWWWGIYYCILFDCTFARNKQEYILPPWLVSSTFSVLNNYFIWRIPCWKTPIFSEHSKWLSKKKNYFFNLLWCAQKGTIQLRDSIGSSEKGETMEWCSFQWGRTTGGPFIPPEK